jgi:Mg2+ and Co2+ transporter CorA
MLVLEDMWNRCDDKLDIFISCLKSIEQRISDKETLLLSNGDDMPNKVVKLKNDVVLTKENLRILRGKVNEQRKAEHYNNYEKLSTLMIDDLLDDIHDIYDDIKKQDKYIRNYEKKLAKLKTS